MTWGLQTVVNSAASSDRAQWLVPDETLTLSYQVTITDDISAISDQHGVVRVTSHQPLTSQERPRSRLP